MGVDIQQLSWPKPIYLNIWVLFLSLSVLSSGSGLANENDNEASAYINKNKEMHLGIYGPKDFDLNLLNQKLINRHILLDNITRTIGPYDEFGNPLTIHQNLIHHLKPYTNIDGSLVMNKRWGSSFAAELRDSLTSFDYKKRRFGLESINASSSTNASAATVTDNGPDTLPVFTLLAAADLTKQAGTDSALIYNWAQNYVNGLVQFSNLFVLKVSVINSKGNATYLTDQILSVCKSGLSNIYGVIGGTSTATASAIRQVLNLPVCLKNGNVLPSIATTVRNDSLTMNITSSHQAQTWFRMTPTDSAEINPLIDYALKFNFTLNPISCPNAYCTALLSAFKTRATLKGVPFSTPLILSDVVQDPPGTVGGCGYVTDPITNTQFYPPCSRTQSNFLISLQSLKPTLLQSASGPIVIVALVDAAWSVDLVRAAFDKTVGLIMQADPYGTHNYAPYPDGVGPSFNYLWILSDAMFNTLGNVIDSTLSGNSVAGLNIESPDRRTIASEVLNLIGLDQLWGLHKRDDYLYSLWSTTAATSPRLLTPTEAYSFDAVLAFANAFETIVGQGRNYNDPALLSRYIRSSSFIGASGPVNFGVNGERSGMRFSFNQLDQNTKHARRQIASWSAAASVRLNDPNIPVYSANSYALPQSLPSGLAPFFPGYWQWNSIPWQGAPPPQRYGGCQIEAPARDSFFILSGAPSPASSPLSDMWEYSFVARQWTKRLFTGVTFRPFIFGGCTSDLKFIYTFGGANADGIRGLLQSINMDTGEVQNIYFTPLPSLAPRNALENVRFTFVGAATTGQLFVAAGQHLAPTDILSFWLLDTRVSPAQFNYTRPTFLPTAFILPDPCTPSPKTPPFSASTIASIFQSTTFAPAALVNFTIYEFPSVVRPNGFYDGPSIYCADYDMSIPGSIEQTFVMLAYNFGSFTAVVFRPKTNELTPIFLQGSPLPDISLTQAVNINNVLYLLHGQLAAESTTLNTVYSVNLVCPGSTCGLISILNSFGAGRRGLMPISIGTDIIIQGGASTGTMQNDMLIFSTLSNLGVTVQPTYESPPPRELHTFTSLGSLFTLFGGRGSSGPLNDVWTFNVDTVLWTLVTVTTSSPDARYSHAAVHLNVGLYIFGGTDGKQAFGDVWFLSLPSSSWLLLPYSSASPTPRYGMALQAYGSTQLIMYGGTRIDGSVNTELWLFSTSSYGWTMLQSDTSTLSLISLYRCPNCNPLKFPNSNNCPYMPACDLDQPPCFGNCLVGINYPRALTQVSSAIVGTRLYITGGVDSSTQSQFVNEFTTWYIDLTNFASILNGAASVNSQYYFWTPLALQNFNGANAAYGAMGSAVLGDLWFLFGGYQFQYVYNTIEVYSFSKDSWTFVVTDRYATPPSARSGVAMDVHGNSIYMFGGSKSSPYANVRAQSYVTEELFQFILGPAVDPVDAVPITSAFTGLGSIVPSSNANPVVQCSPGTYRVLRSCISCEKGYYCDPALVSKALPTGKQACGAGFYGSLAGASSSSACLPCDYGTFANVSGLGQCYPCPSGFTCFLGASVPVPNENVLPNSSPPTQIQPGSLTDHSLDVNSQTTIANFVVIAVALVVMLFYVVLLILDKNHGFYAGDALFGLAHSTQIGYPMLKRQTNMGGIFTVASAVILLFLAITLLLPEIENNNLETRSLVPSVLISTPIRANLTLFIELQNYPDQLSCTLIPTKSTFGPCVPTINYVTTPQCSANGPACINGTWPLNATAAYNATLANLTALAEQQAYINSLIQRSNSSNASVLPLSNNTSSSPSIAGVVYDCMKVPATPSKASSCFLRWTCTNCLLPDPPVHIVNFQFLEPGTSSDGINWNFTASSSIPSDFLFSYPILPSSYSGRIFPSSSKIFRGTTLPTFINLTLTPASHTYSPTLQTDTGFVLTFNGQSGGQQVTAAQYQSVDGLNVAFTLIKDISTLKIIVSQRMPIATFLGALGGSLAGALSGIALLVALFEDYLEEPTLTKLGRPGQTSSGLLRNLLIQLFGHARTATDLIITEGQTNPSPTQDNIKKDRDKDKARAPPKASKPESESDSDSD